MWCLQFLACSLTTLGRACGTEIKPPRNNVTRLVFYNYHNSHYELYCQSQIKFYWFILMIIFYTYWFIMITNQIHWFIMMIIFHTHWFIMMIPNQIHWFMTMITFHTYWFIMMITALFTTFGPDTCMKCPAQLFPQLYKGSTWKDKDTISKKFRNKSFEKSRKIYTRSF